MRNSFLGKEASLLLGHRQEELRGARQSPQLRAVLSKEGEPILPGVMIQRCGDVARNSQHRGVREEDAWENKQRTGTRNLRPCQNPAP